MVVEYGEHVGDAGVKVCVFEHALGVVRSVAFDEFLDDLRIVGVSGGREQISQSRSDVWSHLFCGERVVSLLSQDLIGGVGDVVERVDERAVEVEDDALHVGNGRRSQWGNPDVCW